MDPCELNVIVTAITNSFYTTLSEEDFLCMAIFLRELSKTMFSTIAFESLCSGDGDGKGKSKFD